MVALTRYDTGAPTTFLSVSSIVPVLCSLIAPRYVGGDTQLGFGQRPTAYQVEVPMNAPTDAFISYSSRDAQFVDRMAHSLSERGLRIWRDKGSIRPGDQFPEALASGLAECGTVVMVLSQSSVTSAWVAWELDRVRRLRPGTRIIPVQIDDAACPTELGMTHLVDFRDRASYEATVDHLVWAGVRGTRLVCLALHGTGSLPWPALEAWFNSQKIHVYAADYVNLGAAKAGSLLAQNLRVICVVDPFEDWPESGHPFRTPSDYTEEIFRIRAANRGTPLEIPFLLYSHPDALRKANHGLRPDIVRRLSHYYSIPKHKPDLRHPHEFTSAEFERLASDARAAWMKAQRHLNNCIQRAEAGGA